MRSRGQGSKAFDEDVAAQVKALVAHKRADCRRVVRAFRKLGRGKRRERTFMRLTLLTGLLALTAPADADVLYRRHSAIDCAGSIDTPTYTDGRTGPLRLAMNAHNVSCETIDDYGLDHFDVGTSGGLWADMYVSATPVAAIYVYACVASNSGSAYACGSPAPSSTTTTGWTNPNPGMAAWGNATYWGWYAYVYFDGLDTSNHIWLTGLYYEWTD